MDNDTICTILFVGLGLWAIVTAPYFERKAKAKGCNDGTV